MTALRDALADYLEVRRALGFKLARSEKLLEQFCDFAAASGEEVITTELALRWALLPGRAPSWSAYRLSVVRGLARYLAAFEPRTEVPPVDILAVGVRRAVPFLYSDAEIGRLMEAAGEIRSSLRSATFTALIGLLRVTGMRIGEAIGLDRDDVDLDAGVIVVRHAKWDKTRVLPLHPSVTAALREYSTRRDALCRFELGPSFFITRSGTRLGYPIVHLEFSQLLERAGIVPRSASCRPRLHDLRHTFAVSSLVAAYRAGTDVDSRLALLSGYLGHVHPRTTYWYLSGSPELFALALERAEEKFGR